MNTLGTRNVNRKLVVFVPREALDAVQNALFEAGAGQIGAYERCSWYTEGTGTFLGGEGTAPSVGAAGGEGDGPAEGGPRANPGRAAYGYVLETEDGTVLDARGEKIGVATNNVAEYRALVAGLEAAHARGVTDLEDFFGSEVL